MKKGSDRSARRGVAKRAANVRIRCDLLQAARGAGISLSATLWPEENREAIGAYNRYVNEHGAFSDEVRGF